jgi:hypothetical protein
MKKQMFAVALLFAAGQVAQIKGKGMEMDAVMKPVMSNIGDIMMSASDAGVSNVAREDAAAVKRVFTAQGDMFKGRDMDAQEKRLKRDDSVQDMMKKRAARIKELAEAAFRSNRSIFTKVRNLELDMRRKALDQAMKMKEFKSFALPYLHTTMKKLDLIKTNVRDGKLNHLEGVERLTTQLKEMRQKNRALNNVRDFMTGKMGHMEKAILGDKNSTDHKIMMAASKLETKVDMQATEEMLDQSGLTHAQEKYLHMRKMGNHIGQMVRDVVTGGLAMGKQAQDMEKRTRRADEGRMMPHVPTCRFCKEMPEHNELMEKAIEERPMNEIMQMRGEEEPMNEMMH